MDKLAMIGARFFWMGMVSICNVQGAYAVDAPMVLPANEQELRRAAEAVPLAMKFQGSTPAELQEWQQRFSAKLNELIGPHAPPARWAVRPLSRREFPDFVREELLLEAEGSPSLPLYVLRPPATSDKARLPVVLCLHGHGNFGHDAVAGVDDQPGVADAIRQANYDYGRQLARLGYLTVVPCFDPFGRRLDPKLRGAGKNDPCATEFLRLMLLGRTLIGENVRDAMWALDYATTRADVRADRIGCVGLSYGGRMTMLVTALDPRVKVAVISGALNMYQERIQAPGYSCGAQVIPHLLEYGDTPEIGSLIAPRPAIWEAGLRDSLAPQKWLEIASERMARAYRAAGALDQFSVHRFDGGHVWNGETALPLLEKVLKKE
ncbi:MAG TPA: alpha/beta hydrolase family protein [Chthoniobacteraceae bacterium]|nr:alpha/beta hydrolase family protein [Chthoniobacteraceae bacterium]